PRHEQLASWDPPCAGAPGEEQGVVRSLRGTLRQLPQCRRQQRPNLLVPRGPNVRPPLAGSPTATCTRTDRLPFPHFYPPADRARGAYHKRAHAFWWDFRRGDRPSHQLVLQDVCEARLFDPERRCEVLARWTPRPKDLPLGSRITRPAFSDAQAVRT